MDAIAFVRRAILGLLGTALSVALLVVAAHASEVASAGTTPVTVSGLAVHGPEETLRRFCETRDGALWLVLPNGARYELVTSTTDPAIANPGDGSFHPFDESQVRAAVASLGCSIGELSAEVFLLPYPRRHGLDSAAGPGFILLSPGVRPISVAQQHAEFIHELGHILQYARMPDADQQAWARYRSLRGISDPSTYYAGAAHADRPHEIFAEDFRALFGGSQSTAAGSIENPSLTPPAGIPGLAEFILGLTDAPAAAGLAAFPNPANAVMSFSRPRAAAVPLDLFDPAGRRVATLQPFMAAGRTIWRWDGLSDSGAPVGPGMFFARARDDRSSLRVIRVR